jgi:hypothetical protein
MNKKINLMIEINQIFNSCIVNNRTKRLKKIINNSYPDLKIIVQNIISRILYKNKISEKEKEILIYIIDKLKGNSIKNLDLKIFIINKLEYLKNKNNKEDILNHLKNNQYIKTYLSSLRIESNIV